MSVSVAARAVLFDRQSEAGLLGRIYRQDPERGPVFVAETPIAITDHVSSRLDRVPALDGAEAGRYLLQVLLPNGRVVSQPFEIEAGKSTSVEVDLPHEGPHEWTTLQTLAGQVVSPRTLAATAADVYPPTYAELSRDPTRGFELAFLRSDGAGAGLLASRTNDDLAHLINADIAVEEVLTALGGGTAVTPVRDDKNDAFALFEFVYEGSVNDGAEARSYYFGFGEPRPRAYLLAKSAAGASLLTLPVPWTTFGNEVEVQLLLDRRELAEGEPKYAITITDPMISNALGYVKNGAFKEAAALVGFEVARDLLFHKMSSPLAATVGGYLLILGLDRAAYRTHSDAWRDWVDNLCNWFPWLPDGAILKAAKYFVLGDKNREDAFAALMEAYDRGLPFFTFGLKLMLEGMRRFANEGEVKAAERLHTLEALAAVTDPAHNFLTLNVARHWQSEAAPTREAPRYA